MIYLIILLGIVLFIFNFSIKHVETFDNSNKFIEKIYVINLEHRKDRLEHIKSDCKNANINFERFSAVDGRELDKHQEYIDKYIDTSKKLKNGQIGCALSHIMILEKIANSNNGDNFIILEDDALIPVDFWEKINNIQSELPDNYNIILLGCCTCGAKNINKKYILKGVNKSNYNWCTTAYIISKKFAKKILDIIDTRKIYCGIDVYYIMNIYSKYDYYIANLPFIKQNKSLESDITMGEQGNNIEIEF